MMRLGLTALILSAAMGLYACGGDDDPIDGNDTDAGLSSSSGGSSSGNTDDDASTSSSSGGSSSGNVEDGSVSLCPEAPVTYPDADQFAANAAPGVGFRSLLVALNAKMTELETANDVPADTDAVEAELTTLYAGSGNSPQAPSLAGVASADRKAQVEGIIESFVEGLGKSYDPQGANPTAGKYGKWLFDARGVDLRQIVEKGGFGHELFQITSANDPRPWDGARFDQVVAVYGATPVFGHANTPAPDTPILLARYASGRDARRDGETGIYFKFRDQVILGKHAFAIGADCAPEHTASIEGLRRTWEETVVATAIYYLGSSPAKLSAAADALEADGSTLTRAQGLHAFGEAIGFLWGVRTLPETQRVATNAQLDAVLEVLRISPASTVAPGSFVGTNDADNAFADAIALLKIVYGFTDQQITDFKANYQPPAN